MSMVDNECGCAGEHVSMSRDACNYMKCEPGVCQSVSLSVWVRTQ